MRHGFRDLLPTSTHTKIFVMTQSQRNPGGSSPRHSRDIERADENSSKQHSRGRSASEEREIERARHRSKAFQDRIQEGDEGQGEWESSGRSW
jgi:hypothetical protein